MNADLIKKLIEEDVHVDIHGDLYGHERVSEHIADYIMAVEAKLAKALDLAVYAVNALDEIQTYEQPDDPWTENALTMGELDAFDFNVEIARATLKELGVDMI